MHKVRKGEVSKHKKGKVNKCKKKWEVKNCKKPDYLDLEADWMRGHLNQEKVIWDTVRQGKEMY